MKPTTPLEPYGGQEPYIFVCYAHADADLVLPEIRWLQDHGYHVWYDAGVGGGAEWLEAVAQAVQGCSLFLVFLSESSATSAHCLNEIDLVERSGHPVLAVHLREFDLPAGLELVFGRRQSIHKHNVSDAEYRKTLLAAVKVDIQYRIRTRTDVTIVFVDLRRFTALYRELSDVQLEGLLVYYDTLCRQIAREFSGDIWGFAGDACSFSFGDFQRGMDAVIKLATTFDSYVARQGYKTALAIGIHKGTMRSFRQFIFGDDINRASALCGLAGNYRRDEVRSVVLVRDDSEDIEGMTVAHSDLQGREQDRHLSDYVEHHRVVSIPI